MRLDQFESQMMFHYSKIGERGVLMPIGNLVLKRVFRRAKGDCVEL